MAGIYWLMALIVVAGAWAYGRYWYFRSSGMPEVLEASLSYQTLEYIDWYAQQYAETNAPGFDISGDEIKSHIKDRQLSWRQRNDIIRYMKRMAWVYKGDARGGTYYALSKAGRQELKTAGSLGMAVKEAAQLLNDEGVSSDQAKITAAAVVAAAFRVHAHSASSADPGVEEMTARDIEGAVRSRNPEMIDRAISRASGIVTIVSDVAPAMVKVLRMLGWWP